MNIDEIIRKCVEVPGISIERGEYSAGLFLNEKDGKGFVTFFPLFPGLTLAYISVNAPLWTAPDLRGSVSDRTFCSKAVCLSTPHLRGAGVLRRA